MGFRGLEGRGALEQFEVLTHHYLYANNGFIEQGIRERIRGGGLKVLEPGADVRGHLHVRRNIGERWINMVGQQVEMRYQGIRWRVRIVSTNTDMMIQDEPNNWGVEVQGTCKEKLV